MTPSALAIAESLAVAEALPVWPAQAVQAATPLRDFSQPWLDLNDKPVLVTGGTGSFGKHFLKTVISQYKSRRLIVFSRDELKQFEMQQEFSQEKYPFAAQARGWRSIPAPPRCMRRCAPPAYAPVTRSSFPRSLSPLPPMPPPIAAAR